MGIYGVRHRHGRVGGQEMNNPTPHANVMRALLRAWHQSAADRAIVTTVRPGSRLSCSAARSSGCELTVLT